jgi:iron complex outermembrane recepter protein
MSRNVTLVVSSILAAAAGPGIALPAVAAEARSGGALIEITVTARRREESLQEVPIAITAMSSQDMEERNIENVQDMNVLLPNVSINGGGTAGNSGQFFMRGIPGVSRYLDGVVQQGTQGALINVVELERVEVLRGPQGTLFGKNAIGGAIQYVTQKPRTEFGARVRATLGSYDRRDFTANVDIPLGDSVFTKITAASLKRDGFIDSDMSDIKYGNQNSDYVRGQLLWRPTDSFEASISLDHSKVDERMQANVLYDVVDSQVNVIAYNNAGLPFNDAAYAYGGREQYRNRSIYAGPGSLWDSTAYTVDLNWKISDVFTLHSITGGRSKTYGGYQDLDASEYQFFEQWQYTEGDEFSQELQWLGNTERFSWTMGLYYANDAQDALFQRWQYEETTPRPRSDVTYTKRTDNAIFGEGTYRITDKWSLTAGLRYTEEKFKNAVFNSAKPRPAYGQVLQEIDRGSAIGVENNAKFDSTTPRVSIQYAWADHIMTYLTYSEGFNSGGVNGGAPINGEFISYKGERLKQYEVGLRSDLFNRTLRFNANVFKGYWDDIQIGEVIVPGQITTRNGGAAEIQGLEIDLLWQATDALVLNLSGGLLDTKYTDLGTTTTIRLNSEFAYAPSKSYSAGASYQWSLTGGAAVRLRGDYGWIGDHVTVNDIRLQKTQDAYGLLSARLAYEASGGQWEVALSGSNLTDEWYQLGGFSASLGGVDQGVASRPREFALSVSARF